MKGPGEIWFLTECWTTRLYFNKVFENVIVFIAAFDISGRTVANATNFWAVRLTFQR